MKSDGYYEARVINVLYELHKLMDFVFGDTTGQAKVSRVHCRSGLRSSIAAKKDPNIAHNDAEDINAKHLYFAIRPNVRNMLLPYLSYSLSNDHMSSERNRFGKIIQNTVCY